MCRLHVAQSDVTPLAATTANKHKQKWWNQAHCWKELESPNLSIQVSSEVNSPNRKHNRPQKRTINVDKSINGFLYVAHI